ncbi:MAG: hypothetical protein H6836_03340 [Planctomycetes bacterium]|nr:hypothetical protein [Planctomycetota bacterium]
MARWIALLRPSMAMAVVLVAGCEKRDATNELSRVDAKLSTVLEQLAGRQGPSAAELRTALQPFEQALASMADQHAAERTRWAQLAGEVRRLATLTEGAVAKPAAAELAGLRTRVATMEREMAAQRDKHAADRELMVRALEASTSRLDALLKSLLGSGKGRGQSDARKPEPAERGAGSGDGKSGSGDASRSGAGDGSAAGKRDGAVGPGAGPPPKESPRRGSTNGWGNIDLNQVLVTFLAVALLGLVLLVVFWPGRLGSRVPEIEYHARPPDLGSRSGAVDVLPAATPQPPTAVMPGSRAPVELPAGVQRPVQHRLALPIEDHATLAGLVELLDQYLRREPYVLQTPAPSVALRDGALHLEFYALPTLSQAEHALLDTTVLRMRPRALPRDPSAA